ncbi:hypothetical protein HDU85_000475 [Gaertneriomyces sp. JEL0708]|nr:hypothetical protein HDU85_000475 [Gaertneriomyces sp. JEL0708]
MDGQTQESGPSDGLKDAESPAVPDKSDTLTVSEEKPQLPQSVQQPEPKSKDRRDRRGGNGAPGKTALKSSSTTKEDETPATAPATGAEKPATPSYLNRQRHLTGGADKTRLTGEELEKKMEAIRLKNAELLKKTQAIADDERMWKEAELQRAAKEEQTRQRRIAETKAAREAEAKRRQLNQKAQEALKREREENAMRKAKAMANREWDQDKGNKGLEARAASDKPPGQRSPRRTTHPNSVRRETHPSSAGGKDGWKPKDDVLWSDST